MLHHFYRYFFKARSNLVPWRNTVLSRNIYLTGGRFSLLSSIFNCFCYQKMARKFYRSYSHLPNQRIFCMTRSNGMLYMILHLYVLSTNSYLILILLPTENFIHQPDTRREWYRVSLNDDKILRRCIQQ